MITVKEIDKSFLELYDKVAMNVDVQSEYHVKRINNGLGGLILEEVKVKPYIKDLSLSLIHISAAEKGRQCLCMTHNARGGLSPHTWG